MASLYDMDEQTEMYGPVLDQGVTIKDLCSGNAVFELNPADPDIRFDGIINEIQTDVHDCGSLLSKESLRGKPGEEPFETIKMRMVPVTSDGTIMKLLIKPGTGAMVTSNAEVVLHYNGFWEGDDVSFDSTRLAGKPKTFRLNQGEVLIGIEEAAKTMRVGEESQFLISYTLLFGERGCPPRIRPKADGLFNIELIETTDGEALRLFKELDLKERGKFENVHGAAAALHASGKEFFKKNKIKSAMNDFNKAVMMLEKCKSDSDETIIKNKLLAVLYTNLMVCYNKLKLPKKVIEMCEQLSVFTSIDSNCKALFQHGRALTLLGDYVAAEKKLAVASKLEPYNVEIGRELCAVSAKIKKDARQERDMCCRAFSQPVLQPDVVLNISDRFKKDMTNYIQQFVADESRSRMSLPDKLSVDEMQWLKDQGHNFDLKLENNVLGNGKICNAFFKINAAVKDNL